MCQFMHPLPAWINFGWSAGDLSKSVCSCLAGFQLCQKGLYVWTISVKSVMPLFA